MGSDLMGSPNKKGRVILRGRIDIALTKFISKRMDQIIVKSSRMRELLKLNIPVSVIPNGINFNFFSPQKSDEIKNKLGFKTNDFIILFLGNKSVMRKNYDLAKSSADLFIHKTNDPNIKFINPYGSDQNKIVEYMNCADALLVTSFWEGSPNVVKEAMACNLPIISTDVGDVKEIIIGSQNCFIVNYSKEEISEKLKLIYNNRQRSDGRERIKYLSDDIIAKKIITLYNRVLSNNIN
jgi:glycosyltransferase involved in cell wall biosynthesis